MAANFDFKAWILEHSSNDYEIVEVNDRRIKLNTDYASANIRFTYIEESTIVEFEITSFKDKTPKFYLHFEFNDEDHAKQLYDEMVEVLIELKDEKTVRILLSCSAGLTTSMFADKLNSTAKMLNLDYEFNAVPYMNIYEEAQNNDVILIAPQIGYMYKRAKDSITNKLVLQLPTAIFAKYDALEAIKFIEEELNKYYESLNKEEEYNIRYVKYEKRILSIAIITAPSGTRIYYQVQDHGEIIDKNLILKPTMYIYDLYDIIDIVLLKHKYVDIIGIATPGVIMEEKKLKDLTNDRVYDIHKDFEEKYNIDVCLYNNANAAATGFALEHPEYKNIIYHSQPFGFGIGGQGIIVDGKIITGKNGIAGEVMKFIYRMQLSDDPYKLIRTQHGAVELISKELLPAIIAVGPDVVALYCSMTPDMDEIKNALLSFIDEDNLPEFYYIKDSYPYILSGITRLCVDYLEDNK